ncbi:MAG: hypothetical protein GTN38_01095 [Candidatus Aenigmarchaeota archaeon]|nr:hypothetical protein [Candidatus Aenigmarchaeota archaeon]NIP40191.1 hypothetical protein [Candidatus Aenigmarchaeota archaeon]NIQ17228.1 hypothetical protein [Candidatus Aenigmarchaeota archaeon]NIS73018.1 hypothetical protein [Candidatus Aenigmarchaeota archaeon]
MRRKKGQTIVFEQVLLFTISVAIFIASFALFSMYQSSYISTMKWDQLKAVKEYIVSNIIELSEKEEFESSVILEIPKRIGNDYYRLTLSPNGLNITFFTGNIKDYDFSSLYGLNTSYTFEGSVTSDKGKVIIYKKGNSIKLK